MKDQLSRVTTELHSNTSSVGTLNEKTTELEQQLGTEREEMDKKQAELKVRLIFIFYEHTGLRPNKKNMCVSGNRSENFR